MTRIPVQKNFTRVFATAITQVLSSLVRQHTELFIFILTLTMQAHQGQMEEQSFLFMYNTGNKQWQIISRFPTTHFTFFFFDK